MSQESHSMGDSSRGITNGKARKLQARSVCGLMNYKCAVRARFLDKLGLLVAWGRTAALPALDSVIHSTLQIHSLPFLPHPLQWE